MKGIPLLYPGNRLFIKAPDQIQGPFQDLIAHPNMAKYDLIPAAGKPAKKGKLTFIFPIYDLRIRKKGSTEPIQGSDYPVPKFGHSMTVDRWIRNFPSNKTGSF